MPNGLDGDSGDAQEMQVAAPPVKLLELVEVVTLKDGSEAPVKGSGAPRAEPVKKLPGQGNNQDIDRPSLHQYINQAKEQDGQNHPQFGRKIEFRARIGWKDDSGDTLANKRVQFSYELIAGDGRPADGMIQAADKEGFGNQSTKDVQTDVEGWSEKVEFTVSHYGGDKIKVAAQADEAGDGNYSGPKLETGEYVVWRKMFVQLTVNKDSTIKERTKTTDGFNETFLEYTEIDEKKFDKSTIPNSVEHPLWQFKPPKTEANKDKKVINVSDDNIAEYRKLFVAERETTKPKAHLILCDVQWDHQLGPQREYDFESKSKTILYQNASGTENLGIFDPPLKGGVSLVPAGSSSWEWNDGSRIHRGELDDNSISIDESRLTCYPVKVTLPDKCPNSCDCGGNTDINPSMVKKAKVKLQLNAADGPYGGQGGSENNPHCLLVINEDEKIFNNCILHEIGHMFKQTRKTQDTWRGIDKHPDYYIKRGGHGNHCKKDATEHATRVDSDGNKIYKGGTCVMFHAALGNVNFCSNCKQDLRLRDLTGFFKD